jgi:hypothetical protein
MNRKLTGQEHAGRAEMCGMRLPGFTLTALLGALSAVGASAGIASAQPRAVVELFTSQGCSSCPPADKVLGELANDQSILALSLPIDYWDYLGWKDTLARAPHTARQRGYAAMRGDRQVYTPQTVVNGSVHVLGSDRDAIESAIKKTQKLPGTLSVPVKVLVNGDRVNVAVPASDQPVASSEVWMCALSRSVPVAIGRGENRGRTVTYHNVVRKWVRLGPWAGTAQTWTVTKSELGSEGADAVAVLIQAGTVESPGTMLGAATAALR